jgi:hypothetical protein
MKNACLAFISLAQFHLLQAQQTDSTTKMNVDFSVFADFYYNYDFNRPASKLRPDFLYNHKRHNQPAINLALLKAVFKKKKWKLNLGLMAGDYAKYNLAAEPGWAKIIYVANIGYAFNHKFSVEAGILPSHIGFESGISKNNWILCRSLLAENSPYYETGIKFNYTPNAKWTFSILGLNGWQHIKDNNSSLAFGTQIQFKPNDKWLLNSSTFIGNEKPDSAKRIRFFHNFYTSYAISKKINTAYFFDYGIEEKQYANGTNKWLGLVWQIQWKASNKINTAFRYEYFIDKTGVLITPVSVNGFRVSGFSANVDWIITKNILWRNELRVFHSPDKIFLKDNISKNDNVSFLSSVALSF